MFKPPRPGKPLIVYTAFIAGTCTACHVLLTITASNYIPEPNVAAAKQQAGLSRVEGWLRRQSMASLKKNAVPLQAAVPSASATPSSEPSRDVAHAVVMAAAIDDAEHTIVRPAVTPAIERELRTPPLDRRFRAPSCHELPCDRTLTEALQTSELQSRALVSAKVKILRADALPSGKAIPRAVKVAGLASRRPIKAVKNKAAAKLAYQARLKSERKFALRRFRETPTDISYRSFVGTFMPAI